MSRQVFQRWLKKNGISYVLGLIFDCNFQGWQNDDSIKCKVELLTSRLADEDSMFVTSLALMKSLVFVIKKKIPPPDMIEITKNQTNLMIIVSAVYKQLYPCNDVDSQKSLNSRLISIFDTSSNFPILFKDFYFIPLLEIEETSWG